MQNSDRLQQQPMPRTKQNSSTCSKAGAAENIKHFFFSSKSTLLPAAKTKDCRPNWETKHWRIPERETAIYKLSVSQQPLPPAQP